ncbi:endonuclease Q family protein [Candidatus Bipolaricaulota bacterium]|nr:endonuclease Q family protein [Candidatus Bipolaricaulota bacterium]
MTVIADLHIHSRYSNATSYQMELPALAEGARRKGIHLLGTGDCTQPDWLGTLSSELAETSDGIYSFDGIAFMVTGEVSLVWKHDGKGRRIHIVLLVPSLDDAVRIHEALSPRGNLVYDGRPMLGLSAPDFCEIVWEQSPDTLLVPAHVWTPWYAVFGAKSGFDSLEECFGNYTDRIVAIETGLSSDPPMNRRVSALDHLRLLSCSDAHSPAKLAREATLFDVQDLCFDAISCALTTGKGYAGTFEFYPQEGKYHYDGHRTCGISWSPDQSNAANDICPVCGKTLTIGVLHRVQDLADRTKPELGGVPYKSLIPLEEIISQALGKGVNTKAVAGVYDSLLNRHGTELDILLERSLDDLTPGTPDRVLEGIDKMRSGDIAIEPGYDGVFGKIEIPFGKQ